MIKIISARPPPQPQPPPAPVCPPTDHVGDGDSAKQTDEDVLGSFAENKSAAEEGQLQQLWDDYYTNIQQDGTDCCHIPDSTHTADIDWFLQRASQRDCLSQLENCDVEGDEHIGSGNELDHGPSEDSDLDSECHLLVNMHFAASPATTIFLDPPVEDSDHEVDHLETPHGTDGYGLKASDDLVFNPEQNGLMASDDLVFGPEQNGLMMSGDPVFDPEQNRSVPTSYQEYIDWLNTQVVPSPSLEVISLGDSVGDDFLDPDGILEGLQEDLVDERLVAPPQTLIDYRLMAPPEQSTLCGVLAESGQREPDSPSVRENHDELPTLDSPARKCASDGKLTRLSTSMLMTDFVDASPRERRDSLRVETRHASTGRFVYMTRDPHRRRFSGIRRDRVSRLSMAGEETPHMPRSYNIRC